MKPITERGRTQQRSGGDRGWRGGILAGAFLLLVASLAAHRIYDPDVWMHLAAGDHILATKEVIRTNLFSFTHPDHPWLDVYWLYQVALSLLWRSGGAMAVVLFKLALSLGLATLVLLGFRERRQPLSAGETVVLLLGWLLMTPRLTDRPELVSFVLMAATIALLRAQRWWWCVPLQIVWANLQGYFYWGPLLLGLFAVSELVGGNRRAALSSTAAMLGALLASIVSPFGWKNLMLGREFFATWRAFHSEIEELASPFHPSVWGTDGASQLLVVFLIVATVLCVASRKKLSPFHWMALAASLPSALLSRRAVPVFVLCSLPGLLSAIQGLQLANGTRLRAVLSVLMLALAVDFAAGKGALMRFSGTGREFGFGVMERSLPVRAAAFVRAELDGSARLLNAQFHTGGYLIWATQRRVPVFVDGRLEAYPREFIQRYFRMFEDDQIFGELVQKFRVTHLFIAEESVETQSFSKRIAASPGWRRVYADGQVTVYARAAGGPPVQD